MEEHGIVGKFETLVLEIGVFHSHHVVGEIDFEDVFPIVPEDAFDAEAGSSKLGRRNIREACDPRVLVGLVVIHLDAAADLHLELPVLARELWRSFPLHV